MKSTLPIVLLMNFALIDHVHASEQATSIPLAISGKLLSSPEISVSPKRETYGVTVDHQKGIWSFIDSPNITLIDINFDGATDIAVSGCTSGQCRASSTDVWLYSPVRRAYVHNRTLSKLPNLMISPETKQLRSGVPNAGCAGQSFFFNTFTFIKGRFTQLSRQEQICDISGEIVYQEFNDDGTGHLALTKETKGMPNADTYHLRQSTPSGFYDLSIPFNIQNKSRAVIKDYR